MSYNYNLRAGNTACWMCRTPKMSFARSLDGFPATVRVCPCCDVVSVREGVDVLGGQAREWQTKIYGPPVYMDRAAGR